MCDVRSENQVIERVEEPSFAARSSTYVWALGVAVVLMVADRLSKVWAWSELADGNIVRHRSVALLRAR